MVYTTNAIESINASLRKVTRKRGAFPNPDSVRKVLYLAILKASERWARPIKDWVAALNHFAIASKAECRTDEAAAYTEKLTVPSNGVSRWRSPLTATAPNLESSVLCSRARTLRRCSPDLRPSGTNGTTAELPDDRLVQ